MYGLDTEFAREHLSVDFSPESDNRQRIKQAIGASIEAAPRREGSMTMKRTWKTGTKMIMASAMAVVLLTASAFAFAKTLNLGPFAQYTQYDAKEAKQQLNERRADWDGKVFDKNGKAIEDLANHSGDGIYDAQGQPVRLEYENGRFAVKADTGDASQSGEIDPSAIASFKTLEEASAYLAFTPKLPQTIPAGFALDRFELYRNNGSLPEAGKGKYLSVYYTKAGDPDTYLYLQIRLMDGETAYSAGSDEASRAITIGGNSAVTDGRNIDMLVGDVMYMFMAGKAGLSYDQVLRMAESVR